MSQDDTEDPEGQGGADGSGNRGGGGDPEGHGGAGGKEEPDRAGGTRSGVPRRQMVDDRPRWSRRDEGARRSWWTDGPRQRGGQRGPVGSVFGSAQRGDHGLGSGFEVGLVWSSAMSTVSQLSKTCRGSCPGSACNWTGTQSPRCGPRESSRPAPTGGLDSRIVHNGEKNTSQNKKQTRGNVLLYSF